MPDYASRVTPTEHVPYFPTSFALLHNPHEGPYHTLRFMLSSSPCASWWLTRDGPLPFVILSTVLTKKCQVHEPGLNCHSERSEESQPLCTMLGFVLRVRVSLRAEILHCVQNDKVKWVCLPDTSLLVRYSE